MERNDSFTQKQDPRHSRIHGPPGLSSPDSGVSNFILIPDCLYCSGPDLGLALTDFEQKLGSKDV